MNINRREFIKGVGLGVAGFALSRLLPEGVVAAVPDEVAGVAVDPVVTKVTGDARCSAPLVDEKVNMPGEVTRMTLPYKRGEDPFVTAYLQNGNKPFIISGIGFDVSESGEARQYVFMKTLTANLPSPSEVDEGMVGKGYYFPLKNETYGVIGRGTSTDKEVVDEVNLGLIVLPFDAQTRIDNIEYSRETILASSIEGQYLIKDALKAGKILRFNVNASKKVFEVVVVKQ